jgi:L,D-transpeptidase ErfK/SrfK
MRLYYFNPLLQAMITEPIGIGRQGWTTPIASTQIIEKRERPTWNVPESIRAHGLTQGLILPEQVPPGPNNPLGEYALRLGTPGYLIHGTNNPGGVGRRSSAGCIRMFPEGIGLLFSAVDVGTPVHIIDEPYKLGWQDDELFLEVHKPLQEATANNRDDPDLLVQRIKTMAFGRPIFVNWAVVFETLKRQQGIPVKIGFDQRNVTVPASV